MTQGARVQLPVGEYHPFGEGNGNPLRYSCLENPVNRGAWRTTVHGITKELETTEQLNSKRDTTQHPVKPQGPSPTRALTVKMRRREKTVLSQGRSLWDGFCPLASQQRQGLAGQPRSSPPRLHPLAAQPGSRAT